MTHSTNITGVILAGGRSIRFGSNKAFAVVNNKRMIECILDVFKKTFEKNIIVTNTPKIYSEFGIPVIKDYVPYKGPLAGIITALQQVDSNAIFVTACDMPYITKGAVEKMLERASEAGAVIGQTNKGVEPLFAVYKRHSLPILEEELKMDRLSVLSALKKIADICYVDVEDNSVANINTYGQIQISPHIGHRQM